MSKRQKRRAAMRKLHAMPKQAFNRLVAREMEALDALLPDIRWQQRMQLAILFVRARVGVFPKVEV